MTDVPLDGSPASRAIFDSGDSERTSLRQWITDLCGTAALLTLLLGCSRAGEQAALPAIAAIRSRDLAPIVLITLDTTRRDHLGCYGYFRDTSPCIDALAAESVVFDRAVATMANTLPSHMSMMTGLYAYQHGVEGNLPPGQKELDARPASTWAPSVLAGMGYETAAFLSSLVLGPSTGMQQGFDVFDVEQSARRKGAETTDLALRWLAQRTDRPFFLWIHLFDPHEPNTPAAPYAEMFASDARLDVEIEARHIHPERLASIESKGGLCRMLFPALLPRLADDQELELPTIDRECIRDLLNRYDGDVRYTDDCVGRIIAALKHAELWERAVVAVVGDHGQSLGQHDWLTHGRFTNENLLVPMIVHFPQNLVEQPARVRSTVSTIDLFPTIFARFEHEALRGFLAETEGRDALSPSFARAVALAQETTRLMRDGTPGREYALISDRWRYERHSDAPARLYDLAADPHAEQDVSASNAERSAEFKSILEILVARRPYGPRAGARSSKPPAELLDALKELGYAGD